MAKKKKAEYKFDESLAFDKKLVDMAYEVVLADLFTEEYRETLKEKGYPNPSRKERALWVAYGLFNAIDSSQWEGWEDILTPFVRKIDDIIGKLGDWNYFPD